MAGTNHKITKLKRGSQVADGDPPPNGTATHNAFAISTQNNFPATCGAAPSARAYHASAVIGNHVAVCGGMALGDMRQDVHVLNDIWLWHTVLRSWQVSAVQLQEAVFGLSLVVRDSPKQMVLFGGMTPSRQPSSQLMILHSLSNGLSSTEDLSYIEHSVGNAAPRLALHSAFLVHNQMFVFGGLTCDSAGSTSCSDDLFILDLDTLTWTAPVTKGPAPAGRAGHSCALVTAMEAPAAYIFGGSRGTTLMYDLWCLHLEGLEWQQIEYTGVPHPMRIGHTMCSFGHHLILLGGSDGTNYSGQILVIDLDNAQLSEVAVILGDQTAMEIARSFHSAVLVGTDIVVFGGGLHPSPTNHTICFPETKPNLLLLRISPSLDHSAVIPVPASGSSLPASCLDIVRAPEMIFKRLAGAHRRITSNGSQSTPETPLSSQSSPTYLHRSESLPIGAPLPKVHSSLSLPISPIEADSKEVPFNPASGCILKDSAKLLTASLTKCLPFSARQSLSKLKGQFAPDRRGAQDASPDLGLASAFTLDDPSSPDSAASTAEAVPKTPSTSPSPTPVSPNSDDASHQVTVCPLQPAPNGTPSPLPLPPVLEQEPSPSCGEGTLSSSAGNPLPFPSSIANHPLPHFTVHQLSPPASCSIEPFLGPVPVSSSPSHALHGPTPSSANAAAALGVVAENLSPLSCGTGSPNNLTLPKEPPKVPARTAKRVGISKRRRQNSPSSGSSWSRQTIPSPKQSPKLMPKATSMLMSNAQRANQVVAPGVRSGPKPPVLNLAWVQESRRAGTGPAVPADLDEDSIVDYIDLASLPAVPDVPYTEDLKDIQIVGDDQSTVLYKVNSQELLGEGSAGKVYTALHTQEGCLLAVKQIRIKKHVASERELNLLAREVDTLSSLKHNNIVRYWGTCVRKNHVHICLEYCSAGALNKVLRKYGALELPVLKKYSGQILLGLRYLHQNGVIHRDIKGGNILLKDFGQVKLADFGTSTSIAKMGDSFQDSSPKGTVLWMAPEVIVKNVYSEASDIWSFGCTLIEMGSALVPWHEKKFENEFIAMLHIGSLKELPLAPRRLRDPLGSHFLHCCIAREPDARASADLLLRHPWLTSANPPLSSPVDTQNTPTVASESFTSLSEDNSILSIPSSEASLLQDGSGNSTLFRLYAHMAHLSASHQPPLEVQLFEDKVEQTTSAITEEELSLRPEGESDMNAVQTFPDWRQGDMNSGTIRRPRALPAASSPWCAEPNVHVQPREDARTAAAGVECIAQQTRKPRSTMKTTHVRTPPNKAGVTTVGISSASVGHMSTTVMKANGAPVAPVNQRSKAPAARHAPAASACNGNSPAEASVSEPSGVHRRTGVGTETSNFTPKPGFFHPPFDGNVPSVPTTLTMAMQVSTSHCQPSEMESVLNRPSEAIQSVSGPLNKELLTSPLQPMALLLSQAQEGSPLLLVWDLLQPETSTSFKGKSVVERQGRRRKTPHGDVWRPTCSIGTA